MAAKTHVVRTSRERRERDPAQLQQGAAFLHFQRAAPPAQWSADLIEQSKHYTGTIYLALSRTAQTWASATAVLERRKRRDRTTFGPGNSVAVVKSVSTNGGAGNDEDYAPCDDHPVLSHLMAEANQTESFGSMLGYMAIQQGLMGEAPVWFVPNEDGRPVELYALPRAMCQPQPVSPEYPEGYWRVNQYYGAQSWAFGVLGQRMASSTLLPGDEVKRLMSYNPFTRQAGFSALQACAVQIDIGESIDLARHSHMQQGIQTGTVVYIPGLDQAQAEVVAAGLRERFAGARNNRKPMIASAPPGATGEMKVQQLSESAKELDFIQSLQYTTNYIAAALDVPPGVLGITDTDNYAKAYAVRQEMHDRQQGRLKGVGDFFTRHLCGPWSKKPGEYRCKITLPEVVNKERDRLSASEMANSGIVLVNELRRMHDMKPINGGDLPPSVFVKWVEQQAVPQPQPAPMPGMDAAGGAPPEAAPGAEQAPEQGGDDADMDAVTQAALESLGVGGAQPDTERKALRISSPHKSGVFTDARGHKYRIQDGKRVPVGGNAPAAPPATAKPASTGWTRPAAPGAHVDHDALAKQILGGRPSARFLLPNMQGFEVRDGATLKEFYARGGRIGSGDQSRWPRAPEQVDEGKAKQAAAGLQLQNPAVLAHVQQWAASQADKHADRVAAHFGIDRARAHKLLVSAITKIAEHYSAGNGGWGDNTRVTIRDKRTGKTAGIAPKGGTPVSAPRPSNPAGKGSLPPRPTVPKGFDPNEKRDKSGKWTDGAGGGGDTDESTGLPLNDDGTVPVAVTVKPSDTAGENIVSVEVPGRGYLHLREKADGSLKVINTEIANESDRGKGLGKAMYLAAVKYAAEKGLVLHSDATVEIGAARVWVALERMGYRVERHPHAKQLDDGTYYVAGGNLKDPVFKLAPAKVAKASTKAMSTIDDPAGGFLVGAGRSRRKRVRPGFEAFLQALCDQRS